MEILFIINLIIEFLFGTSIERKLKNKKEQDNRKLYLEDIKRSIKDYEYYFNIHTSCYKSSMAF